MIKIHVSSLRIALVAVLCAFPPLVARELVTDRPDQTESAAVVPLGSLQLETGISIAESGPDRVVEGPGTLLRWGVADAWELRFGWSGLAREEAAGRTVAEGAGDAELGAKWSLGTAGGLETALLAAVSLPVGDDRLTSDRFDPSLRLALARDLAPRAGLGANLGLARTSAEVAPGRTETVTDALYTLALGLDLAPRWGLFLEGFGEIGLSDGSPGPRHSLDGGVTWLVRDRLQLDAFAGAGLSSAADDWFAGLGLSLRHDPRPSSRGDRHRKE